MGFISASTLIRSVSLIHITCAYLFLTAPQVLSEQNIVVILGESMHIPPSSLFTKPTEATALVAVVLFFLGTTDLISASLPDRTFLEYWTTQLPIRLTALFSLVGYIYLTRGDADSATATIRALKGDRSPLDLLKNNLVFTAAFMEVCTWFWIFLCMRDDRKDFVVREAQEAVRKEEERKFRL